MSIFANLAPVEGVEKDTDSIGGRGPWTSGVYPTTLAMAYVEISKGGATGIVLHLKNETGQELRQTLWVASGNAKGNKHYYETQSGERKNLPGFSLFRALTKMVLNKEPHEISTEEKVIKKWSKEAGAEVPTQVQVIVDLLDQPIVAGVIKQIVDKNVQNQAGDYVPSGETREENEVDKFFHAGTNMTMTEAEGGLTEGVFIESWKARWEDEVRDRSTGGATQAQGSNVTTAAFGTATAGAVTAPPSLFAS